MRKTKVLNYIALVVFAVAVGVGTARLFGEETRAMGVIIVACGLLGVLASFLNGIVRKVLGMEIPFSVLLVLHIFIFLAVWPGEIFDFYYRVWWWDLLLHIFSGFGVSLIVYRVLHAVLAKSRLRWKFGFLSLVSLMSSLGGAALWEISEYTLDTVFGTNMQKFIPAEFLPRRTGAVDTLEATDEELVEYYSRPEGYRFALTDTMDDHMAYAAGALVWLGGHVARRRVRKTT